ncbi:MAG: HEPN domain-containing protein [Nitrosopumilus sp.]
MKTKINIFFPIVSDYKFEKYPFEQKEYIINEIREVINSINFSKEHIDGYQINVSENKSTSSLKIQNPFKPYLHGLEEKFLDFSISADITLDKFVVTYHKGDSVKRLTDENELLTFLPYSLSEIFGDKIFEILVLSQIARPGSLKLRDGIIWIDDKRQSKIVPSIINLCEPIEYYLQRGYPSIRFINFCDYFSWLNSNNLIFNESCDNAYQKAINNFSHLNGDSNLMNRIIFQMMTLEQLYTNSINQISEQLDQKIQIYLGTMNTYKKQIKNMYNIRSRFLHGDLLILPLHKEYDTEKYPKHAAELEEADNLSVLLIIATLQKMFEDNLQDLHFEYKLNTHNGK